MVLNTVQLGERIHFILVCWIGVDGDRVLGGNGGGRKYFFEPGMGRKATENLFSEIFI